MEWINHKIMTFLSDCKIHLVDAERILIDFIDDFKYRFTSVDDLILINLRFL
jgi:hypothetical protein